MTTYVVTTANWNDPAFWSAITEGAGGHTLDFSSLPANYTVDFDKVTGRIIISDGTSTFTVGEAGYGGASDATLGGTTLWDFFETLSFGDGDQRIVGDGRDETFTMGAGQDTIDTGFGDDTVFAGAGNDSVFGDANNDVLYGEDGNDTLDGGIGSDLLYGGDGNDLLEGGGNTGNADTVYGGIGDDTLRGGNGAGNDSLFGESGNDLIEGNAGNDEIDGGTGADTLVGGVGDDSVSGGADSDTFVISDGFGNDILTGGETGTDSDTIDGSALTGAVTVSLNTDEEGTITDGADTISFFEIENVFTGDGSDEIDASADNVGLGLFGFGGNDSITGGTGADYIMGGTGDDLIDAGDGIGNNDDTVFGGDGNDTIISSSTVFDSDDYLDGGAGNDSIVGSGGADEIIGGTGNDTLIGGTDWDTLIGGDGNDSLDGESFRDSLEGGAGNDTLSGGTDVDFIDGGDDADLILVGEDFTTTSGDDTILGGEGVTTGTDEDTVDFSGRTTGIDILYTGNEAGDASEGAGNAQFSGIENFVLTNADDTVNAFADNIGVNIDARDGNDSVQGGQGDDSLAGGAGNDSIDAGAGNDTVLGGDGDDSIIGNFGNDQIDGGAGTDTLVGNEGADTITGGDGADLIFAGLGSDADSIDGGADADRIFIEDDFGNDTITGGETTTTGGSDDDTIDFALATNPVDVTYTGNETGTVTDGTHTLGFNQIEGFALTDADDTLNAGNDSLGVNVDGRDGNDSIVGGQGDDSLVGGAGNDTLVAGNNTGAGDTLEGGAGDDVLTDSFWNSTLDGGDGADFFNVGYGAATISGGEGGTDNDTISFAEANDAADITLDGNELGTYSDSDGDSGTFTGIEAFELSSNNDSFDGSASSSSAQVDGGAGDDSITGTSADDTLNAGPGADTVDGGAGNDSIDLGAGDGAIDTLAMSDGGGNDTVTNFEGPIDNGDGTFTGQDQFDLTGLTDTGGNQVNVRDVTVGDDGFGNALLTFPNGESITLVGIAPADVSDEDALAAMGVPAPDDIVEGTSGADTIDAGYTGDPEGDAVDGNDNAAGNNDDVIQAGDGNDSVLAGLGNDSVEGGNNDDTLFGQSGDDTLLGGDGNDSLDGDDTVDGNDSLDGGAGNDTLIGDGGNDTLLGGSGDDDIFVSSGDNLIDGGTGADEIFAGSGNDTITVDQGDTVLGAGGDDVFTLEDIDTTGTGNAAINLTGGETGETIGDTLILTSDVAYSDINFTNTDDAAGGLSGNFTMADGTVVTFSEMENIICFTPGAMILTSHGERPVETLQKGDLVVTRDQGLRPIRWIGKRTVPGRGRFAPIRVGANALDSARAGLLVSPQHRILFTGYRAELLFGDAEVLVPAKHLIDGKDVIQEPCDEITYIHLMFDHHEVIYADGIASESFYAGDMGLSAIDTAAREELFSIFPELRTAPGHHLETARPCLKKHEAALLADDTAGPFL